MKKIENMKKKFTKRKKKKIYNGKKKNDESIDNSKLISQNNIKSPQSMRSIKIFHGDMSQDNKERKFKSKLSISDLKPNKINSKMKIKKSSSLLQISNTVNNLRGSLFLKKSSSKNSNKKEESFRNKSFEQTININKEIEFQNITKVNNSEVHKLQDLIDEKSISLSIINNKIYEKVENQIKIKKEIQNNNILEVININNSTNKNKIYFLFIITKINIDSLKN